MRRMLLLATLISILLTGCTHLSLRRNMVQQTRTITDIQYEQVLNNIAAFESNPGSLPSFSIISGGSTQLSDNHIGAVTLTWNPRTIVQEVLGLTGSRQLTETWNTAPVLAASRLGRLRCGFLITTGMLTPRFEVLTFPGGSQGYRLLEGQPPCACNNCMSDLIAVGVLPKFPAGAAFSDFINSQVLVHQKSPATNASSDNAPVPPATPIPPPAPNGMATKEKLDELLAFANASPLTPAQIKSIVGVQGVPSTAATVFQSAKPAIPPVEGTAARNPASVLSDSQRDALLRYFGLHNVLTSDGVSKVLNSSDYEHYHVELEKALACAFPRGWYHVCPRCEAPPIGHPVGCSGDTAVWVDQDGMAALSQFTLTSLRLASTDPPPQNATVNIVLSKKSDGGDASTSGDVSSLPDALTEPIRIPVNTFAPESLPFGTGGTGPTYVPAGPSFSFPR